jgi:hypothetical protein
VPPASADTSGQRCVSFDYNGNFNLFEWKYEDGEAILNPERYFFMDDTF